MTFAAAKRKWRSVMQTDERALDYRFQFYTKLFPVLFCFVPSCECAFTYGGDARAFGRAYEMTRSCGAGTSGTKRAIKFSGLSSIAFTPLRHGRESRTRTRPPSVSCSRSCDTGGVVETCEFNRVWLPS